MTAVSIPNSSYTSSATARSAAALDSGVVASRLPLARYVETSVKPRSAATSRNRDIVTVDNGDNTVSVLPLAR